MGLRFESSQGAHRSSSCASGSIFLIAGRHDAFADIFLVIVADIVEKSVDDDADVIIK